MILRALFLEVGGVTVSRNGKSTRTDHTIRHLLRFDLHPVLVPRLGRFECRGCHNISLLSSWFVPVVALYVPSWMYAGSCAWFVYVVNEEQE